LRREEAAQALDGRRRGIGHEVVDRLHGAVGVGDDQPRPAPPSGADAIRLPTGRRRLVRGYRQGASRLDVDTADRFGVPQEQPAGEVG